MVNYVTNMMKKDSIEETIKQREKIYGKFENNAKISQKLKTTIREGNSYHQLNLQQREALDMIFHKISRLISGDILYKDTLHDIVGYAKLLENTENVI